MKYGKEQLTLGEVMGQKRQISQRGEAYAAKTHGGLLLSETYCFVCLSGICLLFTWLCFQPTLEAQ